MFLFYRHSVYFIEIKQLFSNQLCTQSYQPNEDSDFICGPSVQEAFWNPIIWRIFNRHLLVREFSLRELEILGINKGICWHG